MKKQLTQIFLFLLIISSVSAQHNHQMSMSDMDKDTMMSMPGMSHAYSINLPMNMDGSGTGWLPASSAMNGYAVHSKKWIYMVHGNIFARYDNQDISGKGHRGAKLWDAPNWFMLMGQRKIGERSLFHFNTMFSLDALTVGESGYPLLFQTGESYKGVPLVDRQHPHDLFSELSISYSYAISKNSDVYIYLGYPGEPALGSVAFMHRPSAMFNPDAPLSHHWNDGTHITFGVATIGYRLNRLKLEASSFTGREPNENRYNFDKLRFDSWSGRVSFAPGQNWSFQVSQAYLKGPESLHPDENVWRSNASGIFSKQINDRNRIDITGIWGLNKIHNNENAFSFEGAWNSEKWALYTRYEWVQKSTEELNLDQIIYGSTLFPINALTIGFNYKLISFLKTWLAFGSHVSFFRTDNKLDSLYGKTPVSVEVYIRVFPDLMGM